MSRLENQFVKERKVSDGESGDGSDRFHTYLYDFPDPDSKIGMKTKKTKN